MKKKNCQTQSSEFSDCNDFFCKNIIEIFDGKSVVIQGSNGIISYENDSIRVSLNSNEINFLGDNLSIKNLSSDSLEITGKIQSIEFDN